MEDRSSHDDARSLTSNRVQLDEVWKKALKQNKLAGRYPGLSATLRDGIWRHRVDGQQLPCYRRVQRQKHGCFGVPGSWSSVKFSI